MRVLGPLTALKEHLPDLLNPLKPGFWGVRWGSNSQARLSSVGKFSMGSLWPNVVLLCIVQVVNGHFPFLSPDSSRNQMGIALGLEPGIHESVDQILLGLLLGLELVCGL